jgi:hypothetical protein
MRSRATLQIPAVVFPYHAIRRVPWISLNIGISLGSVIAISRTSFRRIAMGNSSISVTAFEKAPGPPITQRIVVFSQIRDHGLAGTEVDRQAIDRDSFSTTASRAIVTGVPVLFGPLPETSMVRRRELYPLFSNRPAENIRAPEIEVPRSHCKGARSSRSAKAFALALPSMTVHGNTTI